MSDFDEKVLLSESEENFNTFLKRERSSLITFTKDSNLQYIPDENIEKFILKPREKTLYVPLYRFLESDLDYNQILWHIYFELALYSEWREIPEEYLLRKDKWMAEIEYMTSFILKKVEDRDLTDDTAYSENNIHSYVEKEISYLLYSFDRYTRFFRVLYLCPIYRNDLEYKLLSSYLKENIFKTLEKNVLKKHILFVESFLLSELVDELPQELYEVIGREIFGESVYSFTRRNIKNGMSKGQNLIERDRFLKSFIYPIYRELWEEDILEANFERSSGKEDERFMDSKEDVNVNNLENENPESDLEDIENYLREILDEKEEERIYAEDVINGKVDLSSYDIRVEDTELFDYYSKKMAIERKNMGKFWKKIIGQAKKEENVKVYDEEKGKLEVSSLIEKYPDFIEAEKKGLYKNLKIFSKYILAERPKSLPERLEISFVIDNSGSMNAEKIEESRKALTVLLLSIKDFDDYLKVQSNKLNQRIELSAETWFFGNRYYNVKKIKPTSEKEEQAETIKSITRLNGQDGATDDASCLEEIYDSISLIDERDLRHGNLVKIVFEITDGASSFPGRTKGVLDKLIDKNVEVFSFQIGKISESAENTFNYIWNEGYSKNYGLMLGDQIQRLPAELIRSVKDKISFVFKG